MRELRAAKMSSACVTMAALVCAGCATSPAGSGTAAAPRSGYFFVGGQYVESKAGPQTLMEGQMYVEYHHPAHRRHRYPIVMIHGAAQTGTNFIETPDG